MAFKPIFSGRTAGERGNITVELALVLPLVLFIIAGVLDLGMLFWEKHILTNATREGARAAIKAVDTGSQVVPEKTKDQVRQVVQDYLNRFNIKNVDGSDLVLTGSNFLYSWTANASGTMVTVALQQIPYRMMLLPNFAAFFGSARQPGDEAFYLGASTLMAAEWVTPPSP
ncbi:MAG: TadE/TadG family type IV pilus assembly protein [Deltaproteobacteria bacterium]|nr:TadE/TadG family type IV pilus assembly protein [Deltaproteobacteria bacterium]